MASQKWVDLEPMLPMIRKAMTACLPGEVVWMSGSEKKKLDAPPPAPRQASSLAAQIDTVLAEMLSDVDHHFESGAADRGETTPWYNCTPAAENVIEKVGRGDIYGYMVKRNATAKIADGAGERGHDFAIIDRWLVDPGAAD